MRSSPERPRISVSSYGRPSDRRRRRRQNRRRSPYVVPNPSWFQLEDFANHDRLKACSDIVQSHGGKGPGIDGIRFGELTNAEIYMVLRTLASGLRNRQYRPRPYRIASIPKPAGGTRDLSIACEPDKAVAKALQLCLDDYWQLHLPRLRQSHHDVLRSVARRIEGGQYFLTVDDIEKNFDNVRIEDVMRFHREHISQPGLLWLIETCVRGNDCHRQTGLPQGNAYSPTANEVVLRPGLDQRLEAEGRSHAVTERFVDNLIGSTATAHEGMSLRESWEEYLSDLELNLKGQDGPTFDVREPNECVVLGTLLRYRDGRVHFTLPETYFSNLTSRLDECWTDPDPHADMSVVVTGQFNAYSMVFVEQAEKERVVSRVLDCLIRSAFYGFSYESLMRIADRASDRWRTFYAF